MGLRGEESAGGIPLSVLSTEPGTLARPPRGAEKAPGPGPSSEARRRSDVRKREAPARGAGGEPEEDQECGVLGTKCRQCFEKQGETNYAKYC